MNPNRVRVGQVWRDPDGDQREVLFVEPDRALNVGVKVQNLRTRKITWVAAWRISAYWRLVRDVSEAA